MTLYEQRIRDLEEQLAQANARYKAVTAELGQLAASSLRLSIQIGGMCEAYLANDTVLALHQLGQMAALYERFTKPAGRRLH